MLEAFFIFNKAGAVLFHHQLTPNKTDPRLVGAFLSAACAWAEMYSQSGVSLFMTGSTKFVFDQSHYTSEMVFCIASTKDHDDADLQGRMEMVLENFVHFFWEDRESIGRGIIAPDKIEAFRGIVEGFLN
ncbi:MAG: hypothetical protein JW839_05285 [Candidatus Lokiarchaeota archaeon]|nr:hypothetical protein [Candidatus Lokiarchaeota archaeon]